MPLTAARQLSETTEGVAGCSALHVVCTFWPFVEYDLAQQDVASTVSNFSRQFCFDAEQVYSSACSFSGDCRKSVEEVARFVQVHLGSSDFVIFIYEPHRHSMLRVKICLQYNTNYTLE